MNKTQLMEKLARPTPTVENWALPKEKLFPIDSENMVKTALRAFDNEAPYMTPSQKLVSARRICSRAQELDVQGHESSLAHKYAGSQLSPHFDSFVGLRREATAHMLDDELDKLVKVAHVFSSNSNINDRVKGLDKIAGLLEDFDREHGIDGLWGSWFPDPGYSTYGMTLDPSEEMQYVVKVADFNVTRQDLEDADWSRVEGKIGDEVVDGLREAQDKLAVFSSLPDPEKEIVFQSLFVG